MTDLSCDFLIPAYNEEENIPVIIDALCEVMRTIPDVSFRIIFINDGSEDGTLSRICEIKKRYDFVHYLSFSRNFGHQAALKAGIDYSDADISISMDADMQHPVKLIPEMINAYKQGNDIVYTIRLQTKSASIFKRGSSCLFYKILNMLSDVEIHNGAADFRLLNRDAMNAIKNMPEYFLFLRGMVSWIGFKTCSIPYTAEERINGESKYSLKKMLHLAGDGMFSFSIKPLRIATLFGFIGMILAIFYMVYAFIAFVRNDIVDGWSSLVFLIIFSNSMVLLMLGVVGEYIGRMFIAEKKRPIYIIKQSSFNSKK